MQSKLREGTWEKREVFFPPSFFAQDSPKQESSIEYLALNTNCSIDGLFAELKVEMTQQGEEVHTLLHPCD